MDRHVRLLSAFYIAGGLLGGPICLLMLLKLGSVNSLLLALSSTKLVISVPFATMYMGAVSWLILVLAVPAVVSGLGLRAYHEWARMLGLVVALASILIFPLGCALGAYGLWVLLSEESEYLFLEPPPPPGARR